MKNPNKNRPGLKSTVSKNNLPVSIQAGINSALKKFPALKHITPSSKNKNILVPDPTGRLASKIMEATLKVFPALDFIPAYYHGEGRTIVFPERLITLGEKGWWRFWLAHDLKGNPLLGTLRGIVEGPHKNEEAAVFVALIYKNALALVGTLATIQLSIAAEQAMNSLDCPFETIADTLRAEPWSSRVTEQLGGAVSAALCSTDPDVFRFILDGAVHDMQKTLEMAVPDVSRRNGNRQGAEIVNQRYADMEAFCIEQAPHIWKVLPRRTKAATQERLQALIYSKFGLDEGDIALPTIWKWLTDAEKRGKLKIPPEARKGGRPRKGSE